MVVAQVSIGVAHQHHMLQLTNQVGPKGAVTGISFQVCAVATTPHASHLTPHTSHLTPHTSHLTPHTSHLTPHTSHLTPHTLQPEDEIRGATDELSRKTYKPNVDKWRAVIDEHVTLLPALANKKMWPQV
jgi:hypothetical protein